MGVWGGGRGRRLLGGGMLLRGGLGGMCCWKVGGERVGRGGGIGLGGRETLSITILLACMRRRKVRRIGERVLCRLLFWRHRCL